MVEENIKLVEFDKYCKTCRHVKLKETEEPCYTCLLNPARESSHKPERWEAKE